MPTTIDEVARSVACDKKKVTESFRVLVNKLDVTVPRFSVEDYMNRLLLDLRTSPSTVEMSHSLLAKLKRSKTPAGDPRGISAALVYLAARRAGERLTQREIARTIDVTETTVRARCRELEEM